MGKQKNWDKISKQPTMENSRYRDVYEDQQLDRSRIDGMQSMMGRTIFTLIISAVIAGVTYIICCLGRYAMAVVSHVSDAKGGVGSLSFTLRDFMKPTLWGVLIPLGVGLIVYMIMIEIMKRNLDAQNLMADTSDINQYQNDQHIALPEEVQRKFDWFPDVGAHSSVQPSSMISHVALSNKGLNKVQVARRAETDILDENGIILYHKGEQLLDDDGQPIFDTKPMIDEKFMDELFSASGMPKDKAIRKYYEATSIEYNVGNEDRDKIRDCKMVSDLINTDWVFPHYEVARPAGAYIVDTEPVNTMVLAITRGGKGAVARFVW